MPNQYDKDKPMPEVIHDLSAVMDYLNSLENQVHQLQRLFTTPASQTGLSNHPYITKNADILSGEPVIIGTRTSVRAIVEYWKFGDVPGDIVRKLPHLRLAHIFAALSYYDDHRDEIEHYIRLNQVIIDD
jgi:uncharacterized protein (DUF433 family)